MNIWLQILPNIASQPLAILAYICVLGAWLLRFFRYQKSKDFLRSMELLSEKDRPDFASKSGYKYDSLAALPQKDRLKLLTKRYQLIAYVITMVSVVLLGGTALSVYQHTRIELGSAFDLLLKQNQDVELQLDRMLYLIARVQSGQISSGTSAFKYPLEKLKQTSDALSRSTEEFSRRFGSNPPPEMMKIVQLIKERVSEADRLYLKSTGLMQGPGGLVFWAGSGQINGSFILTNDFIYHSVNVPKIAVNDGDDTVYDFLITNAGVYSISMLINAPNSETNSMYVNIDTEPQDPFMIWDIPATHGFEWKAVHWREISQFAPQKTFILTQGEHKLFIRANNGDFDIRTINIGQPPPPVSGFRIIR